MAIVATALMVVIGTVLGAIAGYFGGVDTSLMRVTDFMLALPMIPMFLFALRLCARRPCSGPCGENRAPIR